MSKTDPDHRLGLRLEEQGDLAGAEDAYRRADERGSGDGASNIGFFLLGWGLPHLAEECFRRADERGSRHGAFRLGAVLQERGEVAAAEAVYVRAATRGSWPAAFNLGALRQQRGDLAGAAAAYEQVVRDADDAEKAEYSMRCSRGSPRSPG